jgi:hypothetical protein
MSWALLFILTRNQMDIERLIKRIDGLIYDCRTQEAVFEEAEMNASAVCSGAMAHAYENVKNLILTETNT